MQMRAVCAEYTHFKLRPIYRRGLGRLGSQSYIIPAARAPSSRGEGGITLPRGLLLRSIPKVALCSCARAVLGVLEKKKVLPAYFLAPALFATLGSVFPREILKNNTRITNTACVPKGPAMMIKLLCRCCTARLSTAGGFVWPLAVVRRQALHRDVEKHLPIR